MMYLCIFHNPKSIFWLLLVLMYCSIFYNNSPTTSCFRLRPHNLQLRYIWESAVSDCRSSFLTWPVKLKLQEFFLKFCKNKLYTLKHVFTVTSQSSSRCGIECFHVFCTAYYDLKKEIKLRTLLTLNEWHMTT